MAAEGDTAVLQDRDAITAEADTEIHSSGNGSTVALPLGAILTATLLDACGGGGSDSSNSVGSSSSSSISSSSSSSVTSITDTEAVRFLLQAQFHASDADITAVKTRGYANWLNDRYNDVLGQTGVAWLDSRGYNLVKDDGQHTFFWPQFGDFMIWNQLLTAPDQMRKRMALALSEYFVVSLTPIDGFWPPYMIAAYWDLLVTNAYGNFRTLLEKITLNAAMGFYLNTRGNLKEDTTTGREPDENYAREIMQLFTIGLYELNLDGTNKLDGSGNPKETYTQSDITNLARVFTGYDYNYSRVTTSRVSDLNYGIPSNQFALDPMAFNAANHSNLAATFLGVTIPANTAGATALKTALDTLFNHPNVGPFFCKQMIQRLVTSNPSPAYVQRVATVFNNNGSGVRGDMKAVWTAILTDTESRTAPDTSNTFAGKLREPINRFVQWARLAEMATVNSSSGTQFEIYDLSASDTGLGQSALRSPSVFNFFRPGYTPPNSAIGNNGKQAPEFQIVNETTVASYINFMQWITRGGYNDVKPAYSTLIPMAHDLPTLLAWLNLHMCANQLSATTINRIQTALATFGVTQSATDNTKKLLVGTACYLILVCPEYLVQK
jgi:uncharacterized protein (DUF1800 family)